MVLAITIGIVVGIAGVLPLVFVKKMADEAKKRAQTLHVGTALALVFVSLAFMSIAVCVCFVVSKTNVLPFALSVMGAFLVCVIVFVFVEFRRQRG